MKKSILLLIVFVSIASTALAAEIADTDTIKKSFAVRSGGRLYIDIDHGTISVQTISGNEVHVELERKVKGVDDEDLKVYLEKHEWEIRKDGNNIFVESKFDGDEDSRWRRSRRRKSGNFSLNVTVFIPENFNIDFENGAGNVEIEDLTGDINGITGAGNITIGDVKGTVDIVSGAGTIDIEEIDGIVRVRSGAGNIEIEEVTGEIEAHTGAGNIEVTLTEQPGGDSDLSSGAGNVTVFMDDDISVDVDARASLGSAKSDFDLRVSGKWMSKSFEGRINGGGPALVLRSGVGSVELLRN